MLYKICCCVFCWWVDVIRTDCVRCFLMEKMINVMCFCVFVFQNNHYKSIKFFLAVCNLLSTISFIYYHLHIFNWSIKLLLLYKCFHNSILIKYDRLIDLLIGGIFWKKNETRQQINEHQKKHMRILNLKKKHPNKLTTTIYTINGR